MIRLSSFVVDIYDLIPPNTEFSTQKNVTQNIKQLLLPKVKKSKLTTFSLLKPTTHHTFSLLGPPSFPSPANSPISDHFLGRRAG